MATLTPSRFVIALLLSCSGLRTALAEDSSSLATGKRFILGVIEASSYGINDSTIHLVLQNDNDDVANILISAPTERNGKSDVESSNFFQIQPRNTTVVRIDAKHVVAFPQNSPRFTRTTHQGIQVTSDLDISIYVEIRRYGWNFGDSFLVLPVDQLGSRYYTVASESPPQLTSKNNIGVVVATEPNTFVSLGGIGNFTLPFALDVLSFGFTGSSVGNVSGTEVLADKPVAVISGSTDGRVLFNEGSGVQAVMLLPVASWGTEFPFSSLYTQPPPADTNNFFHITAAENGTLVSLNAAVIHELDRGQVYVTRLSHGTLTTSHPAQVVHFGLGACNSTAFCGLNRNTFAVNVPSTEHYISGGVFVSTVSDKKPMPQQPDNNWTTVIRIVSHRMCRDHFTINGESAQIDNNWVWLGGVWFFADVSVGPGSYKLACGVESAKYLPIISGVSFQTGYAKIGQLASKCINGGCPHSPSSNHTHTTRTTRTTITPSTGAHVCGADVVFVVDSSHTVVTEMNGTHNKMNIRTFLRESASRLTISASQVHMAIVLYGGVSSELWSLNRYIDTYKLQLAIAQFDFSDGARNTRDGLWGAMHVLYSSGRVGVQKMVIMVTNGVHAEATGDPVEPADQLRAQYGASVWAVNVGSSDGNNAYPELLNLVGGASARIFNASSYDSLVQHPADIINQFKPCHNF